MKVKQIIPDIKTDYARSLLNARGITDVNSFLNPTSDLLQSYEDLERIDAGIKMLEPYIEKTNLTARSSTFNPKILLLLDSDMDGFCAATIIYQWLKQYSPDIDIEYITHESKGHGLEHIIKRIDLNNYGLALIPDASSNDDQYFEQYSNTLFLVLDHHERTNLMKDIPKNAIIINNQLSPNYKNKSLCGAGVTWQFCRALDNKYNTNFSDDMIDLVACAIIGDVMDITTLENRYIITKGLENINNYFLQVLIDKQSYSLGDELTPIGIAFYIVPLINSMCRVGTLSEKERMFLAFIDGKQQVPCNKRGAKGTYEEVAIESARECTNTKAKQTRIQEKMTELAKIQIFNNNLTDNKILTIILDEQFDDIPSEINGLSATKISNDLKHPTLIGRVNDDGEYKGSIRGLSTIDMPPLKDFLLSSGLFSMVAGHANAAGFNLPIKNLDSFHQWANEQLSHIDMSDDIWEVDFTRNAIDNDISDIIFDLDKIKHIYGHGCPEPLICVRNINVRGNDINIIGSNKDTIKITKNNIVYMFFKCSQEAIDELTQYDDAQIDIVGTMNVNDYYGNTTPQIFVKSWEIRDAQFEF